MSDSRFNSTQRILAAPTGTVGVSIAPPPEVHKSKRYDGITYYAQTIDDDRTALYDMTVEKNRDMVERCELIDERVKRWYIRVDKEREERDVADAQLRELFTEKLKGIDTRFQAVLKKNVESIDLVE